MKNLPLLFAVLFLALLGCKEDDMEFKRNNAADQSLGADKLVNMEKVLNFRAHLDNQHAGTESKGQGQAIFQVKDGAVHYKLIVANITNVTMAHIHLDPTGSVVAWLYPAGPPPDLIPGRTDGILAEGVIMEDNLVGPLEGDPLADLINAMMEGETYVNVHTTEFGGGEISGQIH